MKTALVVVLLGFAHCHAQSAGWADLHGINKFGDLVSITPEWDTSDGIHSGKDFSIDENRNIYHIYVYKGGKISESDTAIFTGQRCVFEVNRIGVDVRFSCDKTGKSPLSGAIYRIAQNKNPNDCRYAAKFICTVNCSNAATPKVLYKSHWECYE